MLIKTPLIKTPVKHLSLVVFSVMFLAACGGGNSDSSPSVNPVPNNSELNNSTPTPQEDESTTSEPITSEPIITSPNATDDTLTDNGDVNGGDVGDVPDNNNPQAALRANNELSLARSSCGLSGLSVDPALDNIAIRHANYVQHVYANAAVTGFNPHLENKVTPLANITGDNNPYFGGTELLDRLSKASYSNLNFGVTENIAQTVYYNSAGINVNPEDAAASMAKSLLAAPYHMRSLMLPSSNLIGTSLATYTPYNKDGRYNRGYVLVTHAAATEQSQSTTVNGIFTYPCQDVKDTVTALYNESPDPVKGTGRNLRTDPIGQPIYINVPSAQTIKVSNIAFRDIKRNLNIPVSLLDYDNDPHKGTSYELPNNEAFILPLTDNLPSCEVGQRQGENCGLYGNSEYRVSFDVLVDNRDQQTKSFTFKTGKVSY